MDRSEYVAAARERFGEVVAAETEATPQLVYYTCQVCGHQVEHLGRYRWMPWHNQRRISAAGRAYATKVRCDGGGLEPELLPRWATARARR